MNNANITVRPETPADYGTILRLTYDAFLSADNPGRRRVDEHFLIHLLKDSPNVIPELRLVALRGGEIAGHIIYTKSKFKRPDNTEIDTITFGPLSVWRKCQRQGIGKALVLHSIEKAREMGFGAVLITGHPEYYPRLGFKRASEYGLVYKDSAVTDPFMACELIPGYLQGGGTCHCMAPEYDLS
ncbi:MAG: N-acetyltransferase, partial [Chitinispirillia bacterium]|nr:N-acetyltransferase [Chitinispirillia bacterium]